MTMRPRQPLAYLATSELAAGCGCLAPPAAHAYIYWGNVGGRAIGRANLDGSGVNQSFISGASSSVGVAVDSQHVYWANSFGTIGRTSLDGSGANGSFITGLASPYGVAVNSI
jgi:hypothetical protein